MSKAQIILMIFFMEFASTHLNCSALTLLALASVAADGVDALFAASASKASAGTLVDVLAPVVVGVHLKAGL